MKPTFCTCAGYQMLLLLLAYAYANGLRSGSGPREQQLSHRCSHRGAAPSPVLSLDFDHFVDMVNENVGHPEADRPRA